MLESPYLIPPVRLHITPMGKPRMTRRDQRKGEKYWPYVNELKILARNIGLVAPGVPLPKAGLRLRFVLPVAPSWTKKKTLALIGRPHEQKPDLDNLVKGFIDALAPVGGEDDKHIYETHAEKCWGYEAHILIAVARQTGVFPGVPV